MLNNLLHKLAIVRVVEKEDKRATNDSIDVSYTKLVYLFRIPILRLNRASKQDITKGNILVKEESTYRKRMGIFYSSKVEINIDNSNTTKAKDKASLGFNR